MTTGIWAAASGASGRAIALDVAANNIANATTPGFRADQAIFAQELARAGATDPASSTHRLSVVSSVTTARGPGRFEATGRPLDVAIRDDGAFFAVSTAGGERYTRAGSMQIRSDGTLATSEGHPYLDANHRPIVVPVGAGEISVAATGDVIVGGETTVARLLTVEFGGGTELAKDGNVLYRVAGGAGRPIPVEPRLDVETLELSNVSAVKTMSTLVTATREFDMLTRVIDAFGAIERSAATTVMRGR